MSISHITFDLRQRVVETAGHRCEYCQTQELIIGMPLEVEHITPEAQGGSSDETNLCLACPRCNRHKGTQTTFKDEETGAEVPLFHPRQQEWRDHFAWRQNGLYLVGLTPTGRATVAALKINNPYIVRSRRIWTEAGWHPPHD